MLWNARRLTGVQKLLAFVGGCHLTGAIMESVIPRTLLEISALSFDYIVPGLARLNPAAFIQSSVGTTLRFSR